MPAKSKANASGPAATADADGDSHAKAAVPTALFASAGIIGVDASGSAPEDIESVQLRRPNDDAYTTRQQSKAAQGADGIDQFELAKSQVSKVAKSAISDDHSVTLRKEVLLGLIKSSTVFISYLAAAALDKTHEAGNKTMSAQHVLAAFKEMDLPPQYYAQLKKEYNEKQRAELDKTKSKDSAVAAAAAAADGPVDDDDEQGETAMELDHEDESIAAGQESIAVGEETLAAADHAVEEDEEDVEEA